jgi:hypothetical protein
MKDAESKRLKRGGERGLSNCSLPQCAEGRHRRGDRPALRSGSPWTSILAPTRQNSLPFEGRISHSVGICVNHLPGTASVLGRQLVIKPLNHYDSKW